MVENDEEGENCRLKFIEKFFNVATQELLFRRTHTRFGYESHFELRNGKFKFSEIFKLERGVSLHVDT
jgi:hypothetical protein